MPEIGIPNWSARGVLPPFDTLYPTSNARSPYHVSLNDLISRFGTTHERCEILAGFMQFRSKIHENLELFSGFQWLDGSFLESVEEIENRPPRDIDLVTFFSAPDGQDEGMLFNRCPELFDSSYTKSEFHVDSYWVNLRSSPEDLVLNTTYWYSMWAHRRDLTWKGFLKIDLNSDQDEIARNVLQDISGQGRGCG